MSQSLGSKKFKYKEQAVKYNRLDIPRVRCLDSHKFCIAFCVSFKTWIMAGRDKATDQMKLWKEGRGSQVCCWIFFE